MRHYADMGSTLLIESKKSGRSPAVDSKDEIMQTGAEGKQRWAGFAKSLSVAILRRKRQLAILHRGGQVLQ